MLSALRQVSRGRVPSAVRSMHHSSPRQAGFLAKVRTVARETKGKIEAAWLPVRYWSWVGREVAKQVYQAQALTPPTDWAQIKAVLHVVYTRASNPVWWRNAMANGQWGSVALYGVEAYGIFKMGEMIGRRHVIGYKINQRDH